MDNKGYASAVILTFVFLLFVLLAYTYVGYPLAKMFIEFGEPNVADEEAKNILTLSVAALSAAGLIFVVGIFVWLAASFTKEEEFVWRGR